ncbi:MAG: RNA polymerase sigma factor [Planctomycetota bacterium]|nr:RNA polymerase sigma factor [Planctomycetota bacterium]
MGESDGQLLVRISRGDEAAARELWAMHGPRLLGLARLLLQDRGRAQDAADVVQGVLCSILTTPRSRLGEVREAWPWLVACTRNACLNAMRGEARRHEREKAPKVDRSATNDAVAGLDQEGEMLLSSALAILAADDREVVVLRLAAGLTFDQLALSLGENRNTVASRYRRALELVHAEHQRAAKRSSMPSVASGATRALEIKR